VLWQDASPGKDIMWASWSSPIVAEVKGRAQVIHAQGDGWLRSFDPLTGKLLWKFDLNPKKAKPYKFGGTGEKNFPTATPVLYDGRVYIATGQYPEDGPGVGHLWCIDPTKEPKAADRDVSPGTKEPAVIWHYGGKLPKPKKDGRTYAFGRSVSSVAIHNGLVIATEVNGYVHCLDAKTGKAYWMADVKCGTTASPVIAGGRAYIATQDDEVWVFAVSRNKRLLARNTTNLGGLFCGPVLANNVMYLAGQSRLLAIDARR
jgi:outer membrane protein assembly factor BamB